MPNVVVVRGSEDPHWVARLPGIQADVIAEQRVCRPADEASLRLALAAADCALIDGRTSFARLARRLRELKPTLQAAVVVPPDARQTAQQSLLFEPGIGELWLVTADEVDTPLIERAADLTQRRTLSPDAGHRTDTADSALPVIAPHAARARASDAFLAGLLEVLPDPVFTVDASGAVLSANDAGEATLESVTGGSRSASLWTLFQPAPLGSAGRMTTPAAPSVFDAELLHSDGTRSSWQLRVAPLQAGVSGVWTVVARDLAQYHRLQRQLEQQAADLEALGAERDIQADELRHRTEAAEHAQSVAEQARAEADAANAAKSQFLATMSHELRTPLNAIVGYAELLSMELSGPLNDAQRGYLARLATSSGHLLGLISDILDLAKIDAGGMLVRAERESTAMVIESALAVASAQAAQRGIALGAEGWDADVPFVGDVDRVRQVLLNFLSNAVKFTEPGGRIAITSGAVDTAPPEARLAGSGPWAYIRVTDTGIGIAAEMQVSVFDPFVQVAGGRTRQAGGTGLGLAISRRLARLMGGDLTLESAPGKGSSFTLWLPSLPSTPSDGTAETPAARAARARRVSSEHRPHGLRDLGMALREELEAVLESYVARLRADAEFVDVRRVAQPLIEDHALAFIADLAQTLVLADQATEVDPVAPSDSASILRVIAELHGQQRRRLGWTEEHLARGYALLMDELTTRLRRHDAAGSADVTIALGILRQLVTRARGFSVAAYRAGEQPRD